MLAPTMTSNNKIISLRDALKQANDSHIKEKLDGLKKLSQILSQIDPQLVELGYDKVILKELLKFVKLEEGDCLRETLRMIDRYYSVQEENQDDIMESLLYRYGLSTNYEVSKMCLECISSLTGHMGENLAKHSRQLLQLTEITLPDSLSEIVKQILINIEPKLPKRRQL